MEDRVAQGGDRIDPFGRLGGQTAETGGGSGAPISQIQGRPELEGLWKAPSFTPLQSTASRGPIVHINHCPWRSDIWIIFHNSLPCSIPTPNNFYVRADKLRDELLVEARKHGFDSSGYQDALCSVPKDLYDLVCEPDIKRLRADLRRAGDELQSNSTRRYRYLAVSSRQVHNPTRTRRNRSIKVLIHQASSSRKKRAMGRPQHFLDAVAITWINTRSYTYVIPGDF